MRRRRKSFMGREREPPPFPMGVDDEHLLRMLREVEDVEDAVLASAQPTAAPMEDEAFEPCPSCGEPAQYLGECVVCAQPGCLPKDLWNPGEPDPCLTLCVRCARNIHVGCGVEDEAGNPRCERCAF
jgi:hypothetical protein